MSEPVVTIYGAYWCPDCRRAKKFLGERMVHYEWIDVEKDGAARQVVQEHNHGKLIIPTIIFPDGSTLVEPTNSQLAAKLGLQTRAKADFYSVIVIGGGPAGLTAAIYAAREGMETLIIERSSLGGQASITDTLDNFPGFPEGISGSEFADRLSRQAGRFLVESLQAANVSRIECDDGYRVVCTDDGGRYCSKAVVIATGADYRRLNVPGEEDYIGAGVHFCATCDGPFYKGAQELLVVGSGNSALEEGLFLTKFADHVTILVRGDHLKASQIAQDKVAARNDRMSVRYHTEVVEFRGNGRLDSVLVKDLQTGQEEEMHPAAAFVFIGLHPNSDFVRDLVKLDPSGYILTGHDLLHLHDEKLAAPLATGAVVPRQMETSVPGIFAAGDVRSGSTKQVAAAIGDGASAAIAVRDYLKEIGG